MPECRGRAKKPVKRVTKAKDSCPLEQDIPKSKSRCRCGSPSISRSLSRSPSPPRQKGSRDGNLKLYIYSIVSHVAAYIQDKTRQGASNLAGYIQNKTTQCASYDLVPLDHADRYNQSDRLLTCLLYIFSVLCFFALIITITASE